MIHENERLWNGMIVTADLARAYNSLTEKIEAYRAAGLNAPEHLLNGRHNLINS